jgi:enoyl-CoA hydratase/carnithine racemase
MVTVNIKNRIATVTLGTGKRHNALPPEAWEQLSNIAIELSAHTDISAVIFCGAGASFSAGFDLRCWENATIQDIDSDFAAVETTLQQIERIPVPTIAAIRGIATGGGCLLALACDIRIVAQTARMGMPILRLGVLTSPFFFERLAVVAGYTKTCELLFLGDLVDANEADRIGLATRVVPDEQLDTTVGETAGRISRQPAPGVVAAKRAAINRQAPQSELGTWNYAHEIEFPKRLEEFLRQSQPKAAKED